MSSTYQLYIVIIYYLLARRCILRKAVPKVLSSAQGLQRGAVLKTKQAANSL